MARIIESCHICVFICQHTHSPIINTDLNIQFENVTYSVDESDSRVNVTITLFADIERDISLTVNTSDGRAVAGDVGVVVK